MQVTVESVNNLERKMTVIVPAEKVDLEVDKRLKSMTKTVKLDGFRKGKVPLKVVRQKYGNSVFHEVASEVMQSSYGEALVQEKLNPAGHPQIEEFNPEQGEELEFIAKFEVYPKIVPAPLNSLELELLEVEITDADVDRTIDELRGQKKNWSEVSRKSAKEDQIVIDFVGRIDGEEFAGGQANDFTLTLGEASMIPGFEEQLEGMGKDEKRTINVTFPANYQQQNLAGKEAEFDILAKAVKQGELPEIDETFIKSFGVESGSEEELRAQIRGNLERERDRTVSRKLKDQVMDMLFKANDFEVPTALVGNEIQVLKQQAVSSMQGASVDSLPDNLFNENAKKRVVLGLLIGEIIKQNDITLNQAKVDQMLNEMAADYHEPEAFIRYYRENREQMAQIEGAVLEEQVVDWAKVQTKNSPKKCSFVELMDSGSNSVNKAAS